MLKRLLPWRAAGIVGEGALNTDRLQNQRGLW